MEMNLIQAGTLKQYDITNPAGDDLGQVQDFMIDMAAGRVAYVVVSFGGTLGFSDKWFAMPFDALCWSPDNKKFVIDLQPETLKWAPGIEKDKWPDHYMESEIGWMESLYKNFSCKPYWAGAGDEAVNLGSTFDTGSKAPASGVYRYVSHAGAEKHDKECMPSSSEMEVPLSKGEVFPPVRSCGKAATWKLVRMA